MTALSPAEQRAWRDIILAESPLPESPRLVRPAPMTVEVPFWAGKPPVATSHARPSLRRRVARSRFAADVQRRPAWVGGGLAVVGCAIHSLGVLVGAW